MSDLAATSRAPRPTTHQKVELLPLAASFIGNAKTHIRSKAVLALGRHVMKMLNIVTLILVIVGGINWGLVGAANFDLVAALFGEGSGLTRAVYVLVGLSALYQIVPLIRAISIDEPQAEAGRIAGAR